MSKPIPKSLHTVTVFVTMAKTINPENPTDGLWVVLKALGYNLVDATPDTHGLIEQALKQITKSLTK